MTGDQFSTALTTLGLDNHQAAQWLGVSVKSVRRYRVSGAPGPVAGMVRERMENQKLKNQVEQLGEMADVCVFDGIGRPCSYCRCDKGLALDWRE